MTRLLAATVLATMVLAGCSSAPDIDEVPLPQDGSPTDDGTAAGGPTDPGSPTPTGDATPGAGPTGGGGDATEGSDGSDGGGDNGGDGNDGGGGDPPPPDDGDALTSANDDGFVGANGRAMLRGDRPSMVIEIDVQEGARVDEAAVDHLVDVIADVAAKPAGIRLAGGNTFASNRTEWTADDLRAAAAANRTTATTDDEVSVHILYVRGGHHDEDGQTNAIGLAYSASTAALFPDRWEGLGALLGSSRAIERAVLVHEVGHLFGLVNLTYTSDIDHEDPEHPGHSRHQDSVMYHAIESTLIGQVFSGPPPDTFHPDDRADLEGLRTGRY